MGRGMYVARKQTAMTLITWASRWAAVLAIVLSVLCAQQSWAALTCHCESHRKLTANASQRGRERDDSAETHHSACHHKTCEGEASEGSHRSGDGDEDSSSAESPAIAGNPTPTMNSGSGALSCCCIVHASPPDTSTLSFLTQETTPVEVAPAVFVASASVAVVSINIHGPPESISSRPLYIIQSSLLI